MKSLTTILGTVALTLALSGAVKAQSLLAGPVPAETDDGAGTVTCSAINLNNADACTGNPTGAAQITLRLFDRNDGAGFVFDCGVVAPFHSCSVTKRAYLIGESPFFCGLTNTLPCNPNGSHPMKGSICATFANSTACLQATSGQD